ncbi:flippase-like domain-containing protein [Solirubrobacter phytolaccae]|uniref:Flippase-like domain-containing protein n=1 Tax=Solirubrobacter phytolaccae TaxID=1404360 RepID=A0A9X3NEG3_9ACTN|nr:lysylphosphatidylglycerol synthase transmembrane domain-containing protein [Solirubrobacter phytolaccae]MDA0183442.1 flippase-like domain-containing protein [Solirubrobacter phytolaccae]
MTASSSTPSSSTGPDAPPPEAFGDRVEHAIEAHTAVETEAAPPRRLGRTIFWLAITGVSVYLVFPSIVEVFGTWRQITRFSWLSLLAMAGLQAAALACLWALQWVAMRGVRWRAVISSQLAGNALAKVAPGGGAMGSALQYKLLVRAGASPAATVTALTAVNVLVFAMVLAMPVLAIPALLRGGVNDTLEHTAFAGLGVFVAASALGAVLLTKDGALAWVGRVAQGARNRVRRGSEPLRTLPDRLLRERDRLLTTLGPRWKRALLATVGRWTFDYLTLLAALAAIGSHPRPGLVLLAFCGAQVLAQIPVTPGGLGFVEAGLTAMLALAGVSAGDAVLATFAYRLFSYWLPLPLGLVGYAWAPR